MVTDKDTMLIKVWDYKQHRNNSIWEQLIVGFYLLVNKRKN